MHTGKKIVDLMRKQPGGMKPNGFISDSANFIRILDIKSLPSRQDLAKKGILEDLVSDKGSATALQQEYYIAENDARSTDILVDGDKSTDQEAIGRLLLPDSQCHNFI